MPSETPEIKGTWKQIQDQLSQRIQSGQLLSSPEILGDIVEAGCQLEVITAGLAPEVRRRVKRVLIRLLIDALLKADSESG